MNTEPTEEDLKSPEFNAVWNAIKGWDICSTANAARKLLDWVDKTHD